MLLIFSFLMLSGSAPFGAAARADSAGTKQEALTPSRQLKVRTLNQEALETYRQQKEFLYKDGTIAKGQSWWSRFWQWLWNWIEDSFGEPEEDVSTGSSVWKLISIAALVGAIVFFVMKYMHLENIFRKKPETEVISFTESLKNIHEINFEKQIAEAVEKRNFKIAVRLHYLNALKQLNDAGLIAWKPDKPNSVYLHELRDKKYRGPFSVLTRQFEYVWYGDFPLAEQAFVTINGQFADFRKMLS